MLSTSSEVEKDPLHRLISSSSNEVFIALEVMEHIANMADLAELNGESLPLDESLGSKELGKLYNVHLATAWRAKCLLEELGVIDTSSRAMVLINQKNVARAKEILAQLGRAQANRVLSDPTREESVEFNAAA